MEIVIIGTGNVATVMGKKILGAGHKILQVAGRNVAATKILGETLGAEDIVLGRGINQTADVYIIAVTDRSIAEITEQFQLKENIVAHTAGSVSKDVLKRVSENYGVFYPLQTLRKEEQSLPEIPILYDGNNDHTKNKLHSLAISISPLHTAYANDESRLKMHVAAVIVNNFSNHLYTLTANYCNREKIDFRQLYPLIRETANRINAISPYESQTGPALRNDKETIGKHLLLLENYPELKQVYTFLTESIIKSHKDS